MLIYTKGGTSDPDVAARMADRNICAFLWRSAGEGHLL